MTELQSNLTEYKISEIPYIRVMGRNVKNAVESGNPVTLFWGASGIEIKVKSREVWALVETDYDSLEVWLCVWINGRIVSRFMPEKGKNWICLCRGFSGEGVNEICLMRDSQAMSGDPNQILRIHAFAVDAVRDGGRDESSEDGGCVFDIDGKKGNNGKLGTGKNGVFFPLSERKLKIEFIGDSITSGEGLVGSPSDMEWISTWISPSRNYAVQAAKKLDADFSLVSQCGWGIVTGWDNNINCQIPKYYEKVCGLCFGEVQRNLGANDDYDFSGWQPDFVFVNLGTNDSGAFGSPAWKAPETGVEHKMRTNPDGSYNEADGLKVSDGVKSFLKTIRKNNLNAKICWVWGMIDIPLIVPYLQKGISKYIEETSDKNVFALPLLPMDLEKTDDDKGSRGHPGPLTHRNAAEKIIEFVKSKV